MFTRERHEQILYKLQVEGKVKVKELSEMFLVSEDCIRKDLKQLEEAGHLKRAYGGAIATSPSLIRDVFARKDKDAEVKKEIAKKAYDLIEDKETIFLDISTTNIYLAQLLAAGKKSCIIVSNMIEILQILAKNPLLNVIGTGGKVNVELNGFVGAMTLNVIKQHYFDRCFIGTLGVDESFSQLTTFDLEDGLVKAAAIANAKTKYVVMDAHKFASCGNYKFAKLQDIDLIITDSKIDTKSKKKLKETKINYI
ncbi:MAG: DeoR/GlpR transcriptional regulator [Erysipelotrichia bacterium]|nr:DeoR/GlpR transcriptional regulator [Erysipelotrichia bacterium]NCC54026.1 DeoR/GlpR transcriptional regulator [Erysipelotrichia bacterium]